MWEKLSKTRTGIMDREAAGAVLDADGNWAIADRRESPPPRPMKRPEDWTEEEWEEYMAAWREAYEEWESRMNDPDNYETGERRRTAPQELEGTGNVPPYVTLSRRINRRKQPF